MQEVQSPPVDTPIDLARYIQTTFREIHNDLSIMKLAKGEPFDDFITKGPWVDVRAFGAVGDGVADDTAAFNLAIAAAGTDLVVYIPIGVFLITDNLGKFRHVRGENIWDSVVLFKPTGANKICFDASPDAIDGGALYWNPTITNLTIKGGNAIDKTGIKFWHVREGTIDNVQVHFGDGAGDTSTGSICLNIMGTDESTISNSYFRGARPILAEDQATSTRNNLDHVVFENMVLYNLIGSHPLVEFQIPSSQVTFTGKQVWIGGTSAFYSTGLNHSDLSLNNVRWEPGGVVQTQHTVYIVGESTGTEPPESDTLVSIENSRFSIRTGYKGIYIRYFHMVLLESVQGSMSFGASTNLYDVDGTNAYVTVINTNTAIGSIHPTIGSDLKMVLSIGGSTADDGVAFTRFYTSTKAFDGGVKGKPYVGLMDSLYWTYRGEVANGGNVQLTGEEHTIMNFARIELDAFDSANIATRGSVVYNFINNDVANDLDLVQTVDATSGPGIIDKNASILFYDNDSGGTLNVFIRVWYYPLVARD